MIVVGHCGLVVRMHQKIREVHQKSFSIFVGWSKNQLQSSLAGAGGSNDAATVPWSLSISLRGETKKFQSPMAFKPW